MHSATLAPHSSEHKREESGHQGGSREDDDILMMQQDSKRLSIVARHIEEIEERRKSITVMWRRVVADSARTSVAQIPRHRLLRLSGNGRWRL